MASRSIPEHPPRLQERPSVVITCFNLAPYVSEAIRSVINQDWNGPVDIVVVDDCSTDNSAAVIKQFPEVRYVRTEGNSGVLLAMLMGIEATAGELVFLLDGDDRWEQNKLRMACNRFAAEPALGLLTHDLHYIDGNGHLLDRKTRPADVLSKADPAAAGEEVRKGILMLSDYVWLGGALGLRRHAIDLSGFAAWARALPDPRNTYQDWPLAYWAAARPGVTMGYIGEKLFQYRLHGLNHSGDASTPGKAVRNWQRALNTTLAMEQVARTAGLPRKVRNRASRQAAFYRYLVSLYEGKRPQAVAHFALSLGHLAQRPREIPKEVVRFAGVQILGPERFTRLRDAAGR